MAVYFVQANSGGPVKIGTAEDVCGRLRELQTAHYMDLRLLREIDGGRQTERALHQRFKSLHIRGEWFSFHPDMLTCLPDVVERERRTSPLGQYLSESGISITAFAKLIGRSPEAVRLWCERKRQPRPDTVQAIQEATAGKVTWADFAPEIQ